MVVVSDDAVRFGQTLAFVLHDAASVVAYDEGYLLDVGCAEQPLGTLPGIYCAAGARDGQYHFHTVTLYNSMILHLSPICFMRSSTRGRA